MHKRRLNELKLQFVLVADGPILIKSGRESGADPTLPDMNFVRTRHPDTGTRTIYLPGSSLKGVIRSHSERIIRTVLGDDRTICCDPLNKDTNCAKHTSKLDTAKQYAGSCLACRLFGQQNHASHFYAADAFPAQPVDSLPIRQNVAIDRLSGGVAAGPFDMEVALNSRFATTISLVNFELWQVGLLALALRDLDEGRVRLGFAKSRGLGQVRVYLTYLEIAYPGQFEANRSRFDREMVGVGALLPEAEIQAYGFVGPDDRLPYAEVKTLLPDTDLWGRPSYAWGEASNNSSAWSLAQLTAHHQLVSEGMGMAVKAWAALAQNYQERHHG